MPPAVWSWQRLHAAAGNWTNVKGINAMLYGLAPEALASCSASSAADPAQRCIYPDTLNGTWNVSLTYASETVITLPHFLEVSLASTRPSINDYVK